MPTVLWGISCHGRSSLLPLRALPPSSSVVMAVGPDQARAAEPDFALFVEAAEASGLRCEKGEASTSCSDVLAFYVLLVRSRSATIRRRMHGCRNERWTEPGGLPRPRRAHRPDHERKENEA